MFVVVGNKVVELYCEKIVDIIFDENFVSGEYWVFIEVELKF